MSDVLEQFKYEKGHFACSTIKTEGEITTVLNLFRDPLIPFMEEAEIFSAIYLKEAVKNILFSIRSREVRKSYQYHIG